MAITNYSTLQTAIKNWIKRDDISLDRVKEFIAIAEPRIFSLLRVRQLLGIDTLTCNAGSATVTLPSRFRSVKRLYIALSTGNRALNYISAEAMLANYNTSTTGIPEGYTFEGDNLRLAPIPSQAYNLALLSYKSSAPLSDSASTSTTLTNWPNIYLFASLVAAHGYLEHDERIPLWEQSFKQAIEEANQESIIALSSGSSLEIRTTGSIA